MKFSAKIFDFIFLARPTLMYPVWIFYLSGYWSGSRLAEKSEMTLLQSFLLVVSATVMMGAICIFNQIRDIRTDRINRKLFLVCDGHVSIRFAYTEAFLFVIFGLLSAYMIDIRAGIYLSLFILIGGWLYNFPPTAWKDKPMGGMFVNGMGGLFVFIIGWIASGGRLWFPLQSLPYFSAAIAVMLNTTLPDMDGDRDTGKITFSVRFGVRATVLWALIFELITVVGAYYFKEWILFYPGLAMVPFFVYALTKHEVNDVIRAIKYSVFAMAAAVCIIFPWFLAPVLAVFFGSRWYYKHRFGMDYPNLKNTKT